MTIGTEVSKTITASTTKSTQTTGQRSTLAPTLNEETPKPIPSGTTSQETSQSSLEITTKPPVFETPVPMGERTTSLVVSRSTAATSNIDEITSESNSVTPKPIGTNTRTSPQSTLKNEPTQSLSSLAT